MPLQMEKIGNCILYCGDCMDVLPELEPGFQCTMADPPYSSGPTLAEVGRKTSHKYQSSNTKRLFFDFEGDNRMQIPYLYWYSFVSSQIYRLTNRGGVFYSFIDWRNLPVLIHAVQVGGWTYKGIVPWIKPQHESRPVKGGFWLQTEFICYASKGTPSTHDIFIDGALSFSTERAERVHATQKPISLLKKLLCLPVDGPVLDPFMGSGSTGVACIETGREFVGIELTPEYFDIACQRIENALKNQQNKLPIAENE